MKFNLWFFFFIFPSHKLQPLKAASSSLTSRHLPDLNMERWDNSQQSSVWKIAAIHFLTLSPSLSLSHFLIREHSRARTHTHTPCPFKVGYNKHSILTLSLSSPQKIIYILKLMKNLPQTDPTNSRWLLQQLFGTKAGFFLGQVLNEKTSSNFLPSTTWN